MRKKVAVDALRRENGEAKEKVELVQTELPLKPSEPMVAAALVNGAHGGEEGSEGVEGEEGGVNGEEQEGEPEGGEVQEHQPEPLQENQ